MQQRSSNRATLTLCAALLSTGACDPDPSAPTAGRKQDLTVECLASGVDAPAASWTCDAPLRLECGSEPPPLYVRDAADPTCAQESLMASADLRTPGTHAVPVTGANGALACTASVTVGDSQPPTLSAKTIALWPPNHKFHTIDVSDCVEVVDACDEELQAEFIWASSDEPVDALGDGHHEPDILIDSCGRVQVRAERQGPKDGRVYKLGVRVVDRAGQAAEATCAVVVDHDQRGVEGLESGENYRIVLDGQNGLPNCDGTQPPTTPSDAGTPEQDAGTPAQDAGTPEPDAGAPAQDAGTFVM